MRLGGSYVDKKREIEGLSLGLVVMEVSEAVAEKTFLVMAAYDLLVCWEGCDGISGNVGGY